MSSPRGPRRLAIVTGASRGLGHALAKALLQPGTVLLTMSRQACAMPPLAAATHEDWQVDLVESRPVAERLRQWIAAQPRTAFNDILFIHNAAALSTPAALGRVPLDELARAARVNLEAPMVLSAAFLGATTAWPGARRLLFISSGLGRSAMAGAGSYCATKAGLDHLARVLALEEAGQPNGVRVGSLAPGVIDTDMQVQLRTADAATFGGRQRFVDLHEGGQLLSPAAAASKVLAYVARSDFGAHPVADVRDAPPTE